MLLTKTECTNPRFCSISELGRTALSKSEIALSVVVRLCTGFLGLWVSRVALPANWELDYYVD
jgi:hypothetical protein